MKKAITILAALAVLLALAIGYVYYDQHRRDQLEAQEKAETEAFFKELLEDESQHPAPEVSADFEPRPAELDWPLERLGGEATSLEKHRGKTIFIDVWATWCKPCVAQMPSIQRLYDGFADDPNFAFLLISPEDAERVAPFVAERDITVPVYLTAERSPTSFSTSPLPQTYVINPAGEIVYHSHGGPTRYDDPGFVGFLRSRSAAPTGG